MADRNENIIASFVARNTQRFKREVHGVARSVRDVGVEGSHTAKELEVLEVISSHLERQSATLSLVEKRLARSINDVGDEARQTSRDLGVLSLMSNRARGRKDSGMLGMIGVSSSLKDKLSLTSGEVKSVAITMGAYLSPALIELGSSFGAAVTGAGLVGGAGLTAFVVGLSGIGIAGITAVSQMKNINTAQKALNVSIGQYGAGSKQAAAANAHLLGVIQANGGVQVWNAVRATNALKKAWTDRTGPARASLFDIISGGIGVGQRLLPTFAKQTNLNAANVRHNLTGAFSQLGGREMQGNIAAFSKTFRQMFGPVVRGTVNLLFAFFRILRVASPYAVLWADSFDRWTDSVRKGSRDRAGLAKFVGNAVTQFKEWWGLLKALGRLTRTVFEGSNKQGGQLVVTLTNLVDRFNNWLNVIVGPNGQTRISRFFTKFNENIYLLFSHPAEFIDTRVIPFFFKVAEAGVGALVSGWWHADWHTKLLSGAWLAIQITRSFVTGRISGAAFARGFASRAASGTEAGLATAGSGGGLVGLGGFFATWGSRLGMIAGRAFVGIFIYQILHSIAKQIPALSQYSGKKGWGELVHDIGNDLKSITPNKVAHRIMHSPGLLVGHRQAGGNIPWGTSAIVGEVGPEMATPMPSGPRITPMGFSPPGASGLRSQESILSVSDMLPPVHVHVNVAKREIGKAVVDWQNDTKSRRGGRSLDQ